MWQESDQKLTLLTMTLELEIEICARYNYCISVTLMAGEFVAGRL